MGISRRKRRTQPQVSLTASGERIDLSDRQLAQKVNRQRAPWQEMAWNYRELIGELGAGIEYEAGIMSKVHYTPAAVTDEDEPALAGSDLWEKLPERVRAATEDAMAALPFRNGYAFTGILSTCLRVAGEAWLHGETRNGRERWTVRSSDEVVAVSNGLGIVDMPGIQPRPVKPGGDEVLLRLWKPHPRWKQLSDSPLRRMLDTCEDIVLIGRELRAAARSRVAANGILLVPDGLSLVRKPDGSFDDLQSELEFTMLAPIANEGDAGAVVPVILKGPADQLEKVRHLILARETSEDLIEKLESALGRLREGMNMPPDANQSVKDMNHWSAWSVSQENWKNYLEPECRIIVDSFTEAYLRPVLMLPEAKGGGGLTEDEAELVQVWYDAGNVTENANRGTDARDLYDRGEVGGEYLRSALGAGKDDAPDDDEYERMLAWKAAQNMTPETSQALLQAMLQAMGVGGITTMLPGAQPRTVPARGAIEVGPSKTPAAPSRTPTGGTSGTQPVSPTPVDGPPLQGAGHTQGVLDSVRHERTRLITAERLAEIEQALRERLIVAADLEMLRALERAGTRVRGALQNRKAYEQLAGDTRGLAAENVCALVGSEQIGRLGIQEDTLLGQAFTRLAKKWTTWTTQAVQDVARTVADMLGLSLVDTSSLVRTLTGRIPTAWKGLEHRLRQRALDKLYGRGGDEARGEVPDSLVRPGDIRAALAEVGGLPPGGVSDQGAARPGEALGGLALGRDITGLIDSKTQRVGFTWKYGITPRGRQFEPHRRLNGERFTDWDDERLTPPSEAAWIGPRMAPGDHTGCLCDYVPTWAVTPTVGMIAMEIEPESVGMGAERLLAELDDQAGRVGTTSQRTRDERDRILAVQRDWMERTI
jgi:hypothetical protein